MTRVKEKGRGKLRKTPETIISGLYMKAHTEYVHSNTQAHTHVHAHVHAQAHVHTYMRGGLEKKGKGRQKSCNESTVSKNESKCNYF